MTTATISQVGDKWVVADGKGHSWSFGTENSAKGFASILFPVFPSVVSPNNGAVPKPVIPSLQKAKS